MVILLPMTIALKLACIGRCPNPKLLQSFQFVCKHAAMFSTLNLQWTIVLESVLMSMTSFIILASPIIALSTTHSSTLVMSYFMMKLTTVGSTASVIRLCLSEKMAPSNHMQVIEQAQHVRLNENNIGLMGQAQTTMTLLLLRWVCMHWNVRGYNKPRASPSRYELKPI